MKNLKILDFEKYRNNMNHAVSSDHHYDAIKTAVDLVRSRVKKFDLPENVVPAFSISEQELQYLESCVRETIVKNLDRAGVIEDEEYQEFLAHATRCGLNFLLKNQADPQLRYYRAQYHGEEGN